METSRNLPDEKSEIIDIKCSGAINPNVKEEDRSGPSTEPSLPNCKAGFHQRDSDVSNPAKAENLPKNERGSLSDDEGMIICEILRKIVDQIVEGSSDVKFDPKIETYCVDDESPTRKMAEPTARAPRPRTRQSVRQTRANNSHSEVTSKKDTVNGCVVLADEMLVKGCSSVANAMDLTEKLSMQYEGPSGALISVAANDEDHWKRKPPPLTKDRINDPFCWICHKEGVNCDCVVCPRAFHSRCVRSSVPSMSVNEWVCTECRKIMSAEDLDSNDQNSSRLSLDQLCILLQFVIHRLKHSGVDPFLKPVPTSQFPSYKDYIIHPMDLFTLECNIKKKMYGCTYSFLADARWILHNCIVFNGYHNKLTTLAKTLVRICQSEISELDTCPNCYLNTCTKTDDWFSEPCGEPHTMLWAKLKGFPFWPAKAMRILENNVDVRFFGAHDRAWVPIGRCFMYSKEYPVPTKTKKKGFEQAVEEAESYIEKLKSSSGFTYAPSKTAVVPEDIHCPKKFVLDVSCFDRHNFGNSHCVRTNGMMLPRIVGESADLPDSRRSDSPATSYPPMLSIISVSSPSVSPRSDRSSASATPQPLSVSTSSSSQKSDSDSVTFGGNESPDATIGRNVPDGIFDVSPNMKTTMPRKLDVKVPKLDLNLLSRSRSVDQILKLESAMEKIKDSSVSNADRVACDAAHDVTTADVPVKETDGERRLDSARVDSVSSPMCEVSSTTLATNDASSCELVQQRRLTNAPVICRSLPFDQSKFMSANKYSSVFAKNLRKTIDNCRAKLGIEPNDDVALVESESDEESIVVTAEIPGDYQRKRLHPDSLLFPGSSSRTTNATNTITDKVVVPYVGLLTTATTANSNGGINCLSSTGTTCTGHHPKRMRLSKIPNHVGANSSGLSAPKLSVVSGENPDDSVATKFVTHSSSMIPSGSTTFRNAFRHQQIISTSVNQEQNSLSNSNGPSCLSLPTTGIISTTDVDKYTSKVRLE
ncbi:ZMYND8 (predicted) [Pycnogonum litorale]